MPKDGLDWEALHCIVNGGCRPEAPLIEREKIALEFFVAVFGHTPVDGMEWNAIHAIAYTNQFMTWDVVDVPAEQAPAPAPTPPQGQNKANEAEALEYFGALFGHLPQNDYDWGTLHCFAYGDCKPEQGSLAAEKNGLKLFTEKYGKIPQTPIEWNVHQTLSYRPV